MIKILFKLISGRDITIKEQRKLDSFLFELKCMLFTAIIATLLVFVLNALFSLFIDIKK